MKYYRFPDNKISKIAMALLVFILLVLARDTMIVHVLVGMNLSYAITVGVLGVFAIAMLIYHRTSIKQILKDKRMLLAMITALIFLLPMVMKQDWQIMYFSVLLGSLCAIFLSYFISTKEVAKAFVLWMTVLALYSFLAHTVLRNLADEGILAVRSFKKAYEHYNFFFSFPTVFDLRVRNYGMFREPGVYQFFLIVALYLNNWRVDWRRNWIMWYVNLLLVISMLSTQSTNGVIELILLTGILFMDKKLYKNKAVRVFAVAATVAVTAVVLYSLVTKTFLNNYLGNVFYKLFNGSASMAARTESLLVNLRIFLSKPIFGDKMAAVLHAIQDNTSSTMIVFAAFGVIAGLVHLAGWILLVWDKSRNALLNLALFVTMLMSFNTQNLTWDIMFWLFPMMALTERIVPWLEKKLAK